MRYGDALAEASARLGEAGKDEARLDARLLMQHALKLSHAELISRLPQALPGEQRESYEAALARRLAGEPVHRIIGRREFFGIELAVTGDVLDPRPDTEILVERLVKDHGAAGRGLLIADVGTGSGAIAIAIAANLPASRCVAIDISPAALAVARRNAESAGVADRIDFICADMLAGVDGPFDCIASNPPYIPSAEIDGLAPEVRLHDPAIALDGGADGLDAYRVLIEQAASRLRPTGRLYLEVGAGQAEAVTQLAERADWKNIECIPDLAGTDRVLVAALQ